MTSPFGKRQILMAVLVIALGAAVYLNYFFSDTAVPTGNTGNTTQTTGPTNRNLGDSVFVSGTTGTTAVNTGNDYFTAARANREAAREEAVELIKDVFNSVKTTDEERADAGARVKAIAAAVEQESKIENLIMAKGFKDCIAYIEEGECQVVVKGEDLQTQEMLQITEIVTDTAGISAEKIKILAVN